MNICDDIASLSGIHSVSKNSDHVRVTGRLSISWDLTVFLRCSLIESKQVRQLLSSNPTPTPLSSGSDIPRKAVWCYLEFGWCLSHEGEFGKKAWDEKSCFFLFAFCIVCCSVPLSHQTSVLCVFLVSYSWQRL